MFAGEVSTSRIPRGAPGRSFKKFEHRPILKKFKYGPDDFTAAARGGAFRTAAPVDQEGEGEAAPLR
jgi:hypothetical protein